jgi:hypothetical protein
MSDRRLEMKDGLLLSWARFVDYLFDLF